MVEMLVVLMLTQTEAEVLLGTVHAAEAALAEQPRPENAPCRAVLRGCAVKLGEEIADARLESRLMAGKLAGSGGRPVWAVEKADA